MRDETRRPFVTVKLAPEGRPQAFFLPVSSPDSTPAAGTEVVVRTGTGSAYGVVTRQVPALLTQQAPLPDSPNHVVRLVTKDDILARSKQRHREREAYRICQLKIRERNLPMKLTRAEQIFDGSKLMFYFTADARVDFRELVRELAAQFKMRIEMRQIGVRDEARMLGGYGSCGRPLCCTSWMPSFEPVSIKMAKRQNLSLNPSRLSGLCGRLKCCLRHELGDGNVRQFSGCGGESGCCSTGGGGGCGQRDGCDTSPAVDRCKLQ